MTVPSEVQTAYPPPISMTPLANSSNQERKEESEKKLTRPSRSSSIKAQPTDGKQSTPDPSQQPPKRGRGRPRKKVANELNNEDFSQPIANQKAPAVEDEGKENIAPEDGSDKIANEVETVEEKSPRETAPSCSSDPSGSETQTVKPDPYEEISQCMLHAQIKDGNDYGGECICTDGKCGESCLLRYLTVECGKGCPSGDGCTNRAMQKNQGAKVEVFHTGSAKGFGVRAAEPIKKGAFIFEYVGEVVTFSQGEKRKKKYARQFAGRRHHYLMTVSDSNSKEFMIDATLFGNASRQVFLNHSCESNAVCEKWSVAKRFRMGFSAKRNIPAGEEITFDYKFQNYGRKLIECQCGAPSCRRYLASKEDVREEEERLKTVRKETKKTAIQEDTESEKEEEEEKETEEESESEEEEDVEVEEEVEDEVEIEKKERERKIQRRPQRILEDAERLLKKELLTTNTQFELLPAILMRLTPAHQELRSKLIRLLATSGERNQEAYRVFLERGGRTILEKYLTLGIDEDTTVIQHQQIIPFLEALLDLLAGIGKYTETTMETSILANFAPALRSIGDRSAVPNELVVLDVLGHLVDAVDMETTNNEKRDWSERWMSCAKRAADLAESWRLYYRLRTSFKIPKKRENDAGNKAIADVKPVSLIRQATLMRPIKNVQKAGWQTKPKKEWRDSRDPPRPSTSSYYNDRLQTEKSGEISLKRTYDDLQHEGDIVEAILPEDDDMEIDDDDEKPDVKRTLLGGSPPSLAMPAQHDRQHSSSMHDASSQPYQLYGKPIPGPMPPSMGAPIRPPMGAVPQSGPGNLYQPGGWNQPVAVGVVQHPTLAQPVAALNLHLPPQGVSYFSLGPQRGCSLGQELDFWKRASKYCQLKAAEIQTRLDKAMELERQFEGYLQAAPADAVDVALRETPAPPPPPPPPPPAPVEQPTAVPIENAGTVWKQSDEFEIGLAAEAPSSATQENTRPPTPPEDPTDTVPAKNSVEKQKLQKKTDFKTRSGQLLKRYLRTSMFKDVEMFKLTLRKVIKVCIEKETKNNPEFDYSLTEKVKSRMVEYTKQYVQRHNLKSLTNDD